MDLSAFYAQFKDEAAENVRVIADGLLALERQPDDRATLDGVFRAAHTVKGAARLLGFSHVAGLAHAMESLLGAMRAGQLTLSPSINDLLLNANDLLLTLATAASENRAIDRDPKDLITQLEQAATGTSVAATLPPSSSSAPAPPGDDHSSPGGASQPAPQPAPIAPTTVASTPLAPPLPAPSATASAGTSTSPVVASASSSARNQRATVRVRVDRLDRLVAVAGELTVGQQEDSLHLQHLHTLNSLVQQQQRALQVLAGELKQVRLSPLQRQNTTQRLVELQSACNEMSTIARSQHETYLRRSSAHALLVDELEAEIFAARLVPVATVFATLPRAVRELARSLGKQVELELQGEETEADRKVLDALSDPLLHMVRNALDHGLEGPEERTQAGKPATGRITIAATAEHGQIRIAVIDDGRGMDPTKLRAAAVRKGLLDEQAARALSDAEALELIFMPGFSMSPIITDVSGRGVGMDVVRSRMVELGGQVLLESTPGRGSTITLVLPVSLMTSQVMLVEVGSQIWALPSRSCQSLLRLDRAAVHHVEGQQLLHIDGKTIPIMTLAELLDLPSETLTFSARSHVILLGTTRPIAVQVDKLVDEREVVIKPLGPLFPAHPVAAGIAPLADGKLAVVLSIQGLLNHSRGRSAARKRAASVPQPRSRVHRLLITDDSFTTRELLRSILQSAGYNVVTAVDGQDALDKLRADGQFDLVVSDVEMPRLDGFGLTTAIRADQHLSDVPVIIVTSLHSDAHKRQGIMAGAQAYIVKSQFDQSNLLAAIRDLLGGS